MDEQARQIADASTSAGDLALHARRRGDRGRRWAGLDGAREMGVPAPRRRSRRFNHDTEEFSAIAATLIRHNAISEALSTRPESFEPLFVRSPDGEVDPQPWCMGFYAVMKLRLLAWSRLLSPDRIGPDLLAPILFHCVDDAGQAALPPAMRRPGTPPLAPRQGRLCQFDDGRADGAGIRPQVAKRGGVGGLVEIR